MIHGLQGDTGPRDHPYRNLQGRVQGHLFLLLLPVRSSIYLLFLSYTRRGHRRVGYLVPGPRPLPPPLDSGPDDSYTLPSGRPLVVLVSGPYPRSESPNPLHCLRLPRSLTPLRTPGPFLRPKGR